MPLKDPARLPDLTTVREAHQHGDLVRALALIHALPDDARTHPWTMALEGVCRLARQEEQARGTRLVSESYRAEPAPEVSGWASDLGLGLLQAGRIEQAEPLMERAADLPGADAAAHNRLGALCVAGERLEEAEAAFARALELDPDRPEILSNLGAVAARLGRPDEALAHYERALALSPGLHLAEAGRSSMLVALERADEAVAEMEERIESLEDGDQDESRRLRLRLAGLLDAAGRTDESLAVLRRQYRDAPDQAEVLAPLARGLVRAGRFEPALAAYARLLELDPDNTAYRSAYVGLLADTGRIDEAMAETERLVSAREAAPAARMAVAQALDAAGRTGEAEARLKALTRDAPGLAEAWLRLGHLHLLMGRLDEAADEFERAAAISPAALANLVETRRIPSDEKTLLRMSRFAANSLMPRDARATMYFALAKVHDNKSDYERAFALLERANSLVNAGLRHDPEAASGLVDAIIRATGPDFFARLAPGGHPDTRPIFVTAMPRSGTTLAEQILAGHDLVHGAGELGFLPWLAAEIAQPEGARRRFPHNLERVTAEEATLAGRHYARKLAALDQAARHVVDKLPHNFQHLGLIRAILPRASVVHVDRDARDVALSTFFVNFKYRQGLSYAFDLAHIGRALADHARLMRHWRAVVPGGFVELSYEGLAVDPEPVAERLFASLGLDYPPGALDFHRQERTVRTASAGQVRSPVHADSVGRWKNYEPWLDPLFAELEEAGLL